jgi:hypothetical protein
MPLWSRLSCLLSEKENQRINSGMNYIKSSYQNGARWMPLVFRMCFLCHPSIKNLHREFAKVQKGSEYTQHLTHAETHSEVTATRLPEGSTTKHLMDAPAALVTSPSNCAFPGRYFRISESYPPESQQPSCFPLSAQTNPGYTKSHARPP